jgi:hypothetical protein
LEAGVARQASRRGLLLAATSTALLLVVGLWWALGSFSAPCRSDTFKAPDGTITTSAACAPAPSNFENDGLVGVLWSGVPAALALTAVALTPVARVRAPARWAVGGGVLALALLTAFTPFMLLLLPAAALMLLAALHADVRSAPEHRVASPGSNSQGA